MNPRPAFRWGTAPFFHLPIDWTQRLLVSAGLERRGDLFFPRPPWRPVSGEELSLLGLDPTGPAGPAIGEPEVMLFGLPGYLREKWWDLLARSAELEADQRAGFDRFAAAVCGFLAFKGLDVPDRAVVDLVVNDPEQGATHWDAEGQYGPGLGLNLPADLRWPLESGLPTTRVWGAINLGDEPTSVLAINRPLEDMPADLDAHFTERPLPGTVGELVRQFLASSPDHRVVRLWLAPGEGVRLPANGLVVGGCTLNRESPDVLLVLRQSAGERENGCPENKEPPGAVPLAAGAADS